MAVRGSPFSPDGDGRRDDVTVIVTLARPAEVEVHLQDFDGRRVRTLVRGSLGEGKHRAQWDGRDDRGRALSHAAYRVIAVASDGVTSKRVQRWVTKAPSVVYPQRPRAVTVAVDPGHGGTRPGAVAPDGSREADFNLDIGLRLRRMLLAAGVGVVITRTTDTGVNEPPWDRNGDGEIGYLDELLARTDAANLARADVFLSIHNNIANNPRVGGPSTLYSAKRSFTARSALLAEHVQREVMRALRRFAQSTWSPYDHGTLTYDYVVLSPYGPPRITRPSLLPGVLSEGLFLSHPHELELLKRPKVRQAIAAGYYEAIAAYLASRGRAVGYRLVDAPDSVAEGARARYSVVVHNTGTTVARGWRLRVAAVPAVSLYDGSGDAGEGLAVQALPTLAPGESARLSLDVAVPSTDGDWLIVFDTLARDGSRLAVHGSVALQVPLRTGLGPASRKRAPTRPARP
jgi:N-acetylmuramoyl-L-alanine amidase